MWTRNSKSRIITICCPICRAQIVKVLACISLKIHLWLKKEWKHNEGFKIVIAITYSLILVHYLFLAVILSMTGFSVFGWQAPCRTLSSEVTHENVSKQEEKSEQTRKRHYTQWHHQHSDKKPPFPSRDLHSETEMKRLVWILTVHGYVRRNKTNCSSRNMHSEIILKLIRRGT